MKKFYSFALIILSLFSCVLFSACGDKYRNLKMDIYSSEGVLLKDVRFVIDEEQVEQSQTLNIKFGNLDEELDQIIVYSIPNNLISVLDYKYQENSCSVVISPEMPSDGNAKLVVSHLASGKKKQIPLTIDQKSNDVQIVKRGQELNDKYLISIPKAEVEDETTVVTHLVDLNKTYELKPSGSTDKLFFKVSGAVVAPDYSIVGYDGVKLIPCEDIEGFVDVYKGFEISNLAQETIDENFALKIFPVTYLKDYKDDEQVDGQDKYADKTISIFFKKVLDENNVVLTSDFQADYNNIQLIANDDSLNSFKLSLKYLGTNLEDDVDDALLIAKNYFDMYEIKTTIHKAFENKVSVFTDANNNLIVNAHTYTEQPVEIKITLDPINYVGDIHPVELAVKVKGELKPDKIMVSKDGKTISTSENINIFDYYETGSSRGALFVFDSGEGVHQDLDKMRIVVNPSILSEHNVFGELPGDVYVNDKMYSLVFSLIDDYLQFTYDESGVMISEEIDRTTKIYIKYINGNGALEPLEFGAKVQTINNSTLEYWSELETLETSLNFNRLEGVKSMELQAGYYHVENGNGFYSLYTSDSNVENLYLNRLQGLDSDDANVYGNFVYVADTVKGIDDSLIDNVDFNVTISPLSPVENPLTIYNKEVEKDEGGEGVVGVSSLTYHYSKNTTNDVIGLVYRKDTSLGEYKIVFSQENIERAVLICKVYEDLNELKTEYVSLETNKQAFKNNDYPQFKSDYIVAAGEKLGLSITLPQAIYDSNILEGFEYEFNIGKIEDGDFTPNGGNVEEYFNIEAIDGTNSLIDLNFTKGTFVDGAPQYINLTIKAGIKRHANIVSEAVLANPVPSINLSFFVYEIITEEDLTINHTNYVTYPEELMAVDYKHLSELELKVDMANDLWNYTTTPSNVMWNINGENLEFNYDQDGDGINDCYIDNGVLVTNDLGSNTCLFKFGSIIGLSSYTKVIKAFITQFNTVLELQCVVYVEEPIITERVVVKSKTYVLDDENRTPYINLKVGEKYQVLAENISKLGQVTHPEIVIQVADVYGNAYSAKKFFTINPTTCEITVNSIENINKFKLIVFAKDALKETISQDKSGYNMPSIFLMNDYSNAYFVIDIYLSDGSESNPYLIKNATDFWEINSNELFKQAHYQLMANISLDDIGDDQIKTIDSFKGTISSLNNTIYTLDGIYLNKDMRNLFTNFSGELVNIKFSINYNYDIDSSNNGYLGLIDINKGTLTNVGVYARGIANLNGTATYYLGSLVGENKGTIEYKYGVDDNDVMWNGIVGVEGFVEVSGDALIYVGGLVGKNIAFIKGCETYDAAGGENTIILNVAGSRENALSQLTLNVSNLSETSAVGGVVGLNTYGTDVGIVQNAFVQAVINAENTSNIGGVIGENLQQENFISIEGTDAGIVVEEDVYSTLNDVYLSKAIYNVKSASQIVGYNNVGGIVGLDFNGIYLDCDYQILTKQYKETVIIANKAAGGIAGNSDSGKFIFCSVMSYNWNYSAINDELVNVISGVEDIFAEDYVGGIVGFAINNSSNIVTGNNPISSKVVIISSSVNAYLKSNANIGGIVSSFEGSSVMFNVYFIGKLQGDLLYNEVEVGVVMQRFVLDNDKSSHFNAAYSLNIDTSSGLELVEGKILNNTNFNINSSANLQDYWAYNEFINGGYIFVTKDKEGTDDSSPIFDLAPDSIDVVVKGKTDGDDLARVLMLDYYDFSIDENVTYDILSTLIERTNRSQYIYKMEYGNNIGLLDITAKPSSLGSVMINVKSTNTSVIDITYDGKLIINGVGECELIFSSTLNPNAGDIEKRTIKVVVDYPITDLHLSSSRTDIAGYVGSSENIGQGSSKQYYTVTNGVYTFDSNEYKYRTKSNLNLEVEVSTTVAGVNIEDYIAITGTKTVTATTYFVDIDNKTPFMLSVLRRLEDNSSYFTVNVTPYVLVDGVKVEESTITFNLYTLEGITKIAFSYDDAIVYPNDVVYLNAYLSTDNALQNSAVLDKLNIKTTTNKYSFVADEVIGNSKKYLIKKDNLQIGYFVVYVSDNIYSENLQTIKFRIEFSDLMLDEELNMEFGFGVFDSVNYLILPQRINKIEIKNYYYRNTESGQELVQQNILKPSSFGYMIIDLVPDNGYYDYLEISDITGNEEIVFIQIDEDGNALSVKFDPSSDGKGIKLYDYSETNNKTSRSRIYIKTQISKDYSSKLHTIEIRAYSAGDKLIASSRKHIEVKMLPEIEVAHLLPNSQDGVVAGNASGKIAAVSGVYLANGVDSILRVKTKNTNTDVSIVITSDDGVESNYDIVKLTDNQYQLDCKAYNVNNVGKKFKVTFTAYSILENGDFDVAQCSIEFEITTFVIHGVSVNSSIDSSNGSEIYGYYNRDINLEIYFGKYDISFYDVSADGEFFHNTEYKYDKNYSSKYDSNTYLYQVYDILYKLNTYDGSTGINEYLVLNNNKRNSLDSTKYEDVESGDIKNISLNKNILNVQEEYSPKYLAVAFKMFYSSNIWEVENYKSTNTNTNNYVVDKNYYLNFRKATNWFEPTVINSVDEFKKMDFGGRYILNLDLVGNNALTDYTPINKHILEFDGNGHTIEIKSFANFNDPSIQAGLFAKIYGEEVVGDTSYPAMIVKNVKVKYVSADFDGDNEYSFGSINQDKDSVQYYDITNNSDIAYTDAKFGGIAAVNSGMITNCVVEGFVAVNASRLETQTGNSNEEYKINFNIGGVVAENASTGYVTNCRSELSIFSQSNVGGFVHTNNGKIVSSGVEENSTIYGYNEKLGNTIIVDIAGFVVENSGEISMSYVNLVKKNEILLRVDGGNTKIYQGTMSAKDFSAGFVFNNKGVIYDVFAQISETGVNNNRFAGFADSNAGEITRVYTFINSGIKASKDDVMFVGQNTGTLKDCIQFVVDNSNSQIEGLNSVSISLRNEKSCYEQYGFAFGDNKTAVWSIQAGTLPKIVSTQELKFEDFKKLTISEIEDNVDDDVDEVKYEVDFANYGTKQNPFIIHDLETWNYRFDPTNNINMTAYYRIIKDIDFTAVGKNPITSTVTFSGNIQGNNMALSGVMLYSTSSLSSIGLFEKVKGSVDKSVDNSIRNLTIRATSVWASSTKAVGILAGIIEDFNLYNINIDSNNLIIVGGNAVGGLAGVVRGEIDLDQITSNVGANSTRASTLVNYSIYMSRNNGSDVSYNLDKVYYAGSVAGIVDGYDRVNYNLSTQREITREYFKVRNISVAGDVTVYGDTVGVAFGLIGERVSLNNLDVNVSGTLFGEQYSAGAVGENRGLLTNSTIKLADDVFRKSKYVSAGAVGFNLGGLVDNVEVKANIIKKDYAQTSGGIIGRNVNGVVSNVNYDGELFSYFAGGIIGANYNYQMMIDTTTGTGSISAECKINEKLIPKSQVTYSNNEVAIDNFKNVSISLNSFNKFIENSKLAYSYKNDENNNNNKLNLIIVKQKVLGLVVGLSYDNNIVSKTSNKYNINLGSEKITFNASSVNNKIEFKDKLENVVLQNSTKPEDVVKFSFDNVNILNYNVKEPTLLYLVGATTNSFDSWGNYSNEYLLLKN